MILPTQKMRQIRRRLLCMWYFGIFDELTVKYLAAAAFIHPLSSIGKGREAFARWRRDRVWSLVPFLFCGWQV